MGMGPDLAAQKLNIQNSVAQDQATQDLVAQIKRLRADRDAVIVAHNYQIDEVQDIADKVGDSFALSSYCASVPKSVIVFCGVHFMAESAKILSPEKTVLLPEKDAGCPMADMIGADDLREAKKEHPGAAVVCYINSSAAVKAESDICCTSSNAVDVIRSLPNKEILFVPDKNLGHYVAREVPDKRIILWEGFCITHQGVSADETMRVKAMHPDALLLVHPECRPEVVDLADFVGSTKQIIDYAASSKARKFIIGTEMGVLHKLKTDNPGKQFLLLSGRLVCPNMKKTRLKSVYNALDGMRNRIEVEESVRSRAYTALARMLAIK